MIYTWNKTDIKKYLTLSKILRNKNNIDHFNTILSLISEDKKINKNDILLLDKKEEIDFLDSFKIFITGLEYIPEDLYSDITDMFTWFEDYDGLSNRLEYKDLKLSNNDIINIAYEIIASMKNKELLDSFKTLITPSNHLLHITSSSSDTSTVTSKLGGITFRNPYNKNGYVIEFRNNTIEDIEILVHEFMHFFYGNLLHKCFANKGAKCLTELEGQYASIYSERYLEKIFKEEALKLRKNQIDTILTSSYLLMVNQALFQTSKDKSFDLQSAANLVNKHLSKGKISILPEELTSYLTVQGFQDMTNILSYIVSLEIINEDLPNDALNLIYNLKFEDGSNITSLLNKYGFHFQNDEYKDLKKEYILTHK